MKVIYEFTPNEWIVPAMKFVGEIYKLGSHPMETGKAKRLYQELMSDLDPDLVTKMIDRCKYAYSHVLRENIILTAEELVVLRRLEDLVHRVYKVPGHIAEIPLPNR